MIMTSSPVLTPHSRSLAHTPSPSSSPILRPVPSTMAKQPAISIGSGTSSSAPTRSYVRRPEPRPYDTGFGPSARKFGGRGTPKPIDEESKRFAEIVVRMIGERAEEKRKGELIEMIEHVNLHDPLDEETNSTTGPHLMPPRRSQSLAGSLTNSWETERAELIVDYPAWSPGCFQDLSTLHALRETTLSHTHTLLGHLLKVHGTPASYKLLARSAVTPPGPNPSPFHHGWGCVRLAPSHSSSSSPITTVNKHELTPEVRRVSLVHTHSSPPVAFRSGLGLTTHTPAHPDYCHLPENSVMVDSDDEDDSPAPAIKLREGFSNWSGSGSSSGSEDEDEEESADVIVAREIERRGGKEGTVFLMTLFGQPALILT